MGWRAVVGWGGADSSANGTRLLVCQVGRSCQIAVTSHVAAGASLDRDRPSATYTLDSNISIMGMAELEVFISYRRDTDAARAVMLDREISGAFNYPNETPSVIIYRDTSERLGVPWPQEVHDRCSAADIVLVVIGPNWLGAKDRYERRRIDQRDDWVRQEIEIALAGNKTLIPIVFGLTKMLPSEGLPESIADLAQRRGVRVRDEFPDDFQPVLREIELPLPGRTKKMFGQMLEEIITICLIPALRSHQTGSDDGRRYRHCAT